MFNKRIKVKELLAQEPQGQEVTVMGWVRNFRNKQFIDLNDGSTNQNIQVMVELGKFDAELRKRITTSASLKVTGTVVPSLGKGQKMDLKAASIEILGDSDAEKYPLQPKKHSLEFLREIAHLRFRTNTFGSVFRVRHSLAFAIHKFFNEKGFVYMHTPIITASDAEGAGEMFRVTTLPMDGSAPKNEDGSINYKEDFFGRSTNLTVSGQLEGELGATAFGEIYTFGPTFRAENSNTARHLAEFWMIEPEMAFCDLIGNMEIAESFVKYVIAYVLEHCAEDMQFFDNWVEKGIIQSLESVATANFERMTYTDAISALEKASQKFEFPVSWGIDIQTEHERYLTEKHVGRPVFVTNYPKDIKAFYMRLDEGERTVSAMDLLVPRLGEIIGGSQREEREEVLRRRIRECDLPEEAYWWYLDLRRFGSVPHAGFGLGFERLVMYLTGMQNIRDVIPFPRTPGSADF